MFEFEVDYIYIRFVNLYYFKYSIYGLLLWWWHTSPDSCPDTSDDRSTKDSWWHGRKFLVLSTHARMTVDKYSGKVGLH